MILTGLPRANGCDVCNMFYCATLWNGNLGSIFSPVERPPVSCFSLAERSSPSAAAFVVDEQSGVGGIEAVAVNEQNLDLMSVTEYAWISQMLPLFTIPPLYTPISFPSSFPTLHHYSFPPYLLPTLPTSFYPPFYQDCSAVD